MSSLFVPDLNALPGAAAKMLDELGDRRIVAFYGEMGAGKTTFIKALCRVLEVSDVTSSPSFGLINEYRSETGSSVYHIDFYRIRDIEEAYDLGYEEYMYSGHYCFIEWPEKVASILPEDSVKVYISLDKNGGREIRIEPDA